jgi:electron transport complex protein RnfC
LDACDGVKKETFKILMGGPMMGHAQYDMDAPIGKGTNAILAFCEDEERTVEHPKCIRCGKCVSVCPMHLQPVFMNMYEQAGKMEELEKANVLDCIECGSCAYICPGRLHLVQTFRAGKQKINNARAAAKAAAEAAAKQEKKEA